MPQIRREGRQPRLDVAAVVIPTEQRLDGHRMPEVVQPGRERRVRADAGVLAETSECRPGRACVEPFAAQRHEEALLAWVRAELISLAGVAGQRLLGALVQR